MALPHVLHPLEEADVISTLNQQSAQAVSETPRGEKSIKCPTNGVAFLLLYSSRYVRVTSTIFAIAASLYSFQGVASGVPLDSDASIFVYKGF